MTAGFSSTIGLTAGVLTQGQSYGETSSNNPPTYVERAMYIDFEGTMNHHRCSGPHRRDGEVEFDQPVFEEALWLTPATPH